jgi:hypothetical protein
MWYGPHYPLAQTYSWKCVWGSIYGIASFGCHPKLYIVDCDCLFSFFIADKLPNLIGGFVRSDLDLDPSSWMKGWYHNHIGIGAPLLFVFCFPMLLKIGQRLTNLFFLQIRFWNDIFQHDWLVMMMMFNLLSHHLAFKKFKWWFKGRLFKTFAHFAQLMGLGKWVWKLQAPWKIGYKNV